MYMWSNNYVYVHQVYILTYPQVHIWQMHWALLAILQQSIRLISCYSCAVAANLLCFLASQPQPTRTQRQSLSVSMETYHMIGKIHVLTIIAGHALFTWRRVIGTLLCADGRCLLSESITFLERYLGTFTRTWMLVWSCTRLGELIQTASLEICLRAWAPSLSRWRGTREHSERGRKSKCMVMWNEKELVAAAVWSPGRRWEYCTIILASPSSRTSHQNMSLLV